MAPTKTWYAGLSDSGKTLESWSSGWLFSGVVILAAFTIANMSRRLLHFLILTELLLLVPRGVVVFFNIPGLNWLLSSAAVCLYCSYVLHNVIAWLKVKPFLSTRLSNVFIGTLACTCAFWVTEMYSNFRYYNLHQDLPWQHTRVLEALFRDPWWIFSCLNLVYNIKKRYGFGIIQIVHVAPRFGLMLSAMVLSVVFLCVDIATTVKPLDGATGVNPFWKVSLVLKCFCDTIILDDFKTALDRLRSKSLERSKVQNSNPHGNSIINGTISSRTVKTGQVKAATVDIERGDSDIELTDPNAIYVNHTVAVEGSPKTWTSLETCDSLNKQ